MHVNVWEDRPTVDEPERRIRLDVSMERARSLMITFLNRKRSLQDSFADQMSQPTPETQRDEHKFELKGINERLEERKHYRLVRPFFCNGDRHEQSWANSSELLPHANSNMSASRSWLSTS
jgi:hypothetical protein